MIDPNIKNYLVNSVNDLPRTKEEFFTQLWTNKRLRYNGKADTLDLIDQINAKIGCAVLNGNKQIIIVFPDNDSKRQASLIATGLVMSSIDQIDEHKTGKLVLYFGTKIGMRYHLSSISVNSLSLTKVFTQIYGTTKPDGNVNENSLPNVYCIYSPIDPIGLITKFKPLWIAIDCDELSSSVKWLDETLSFIKSKNIPLIAWTSNPLSSTLQKFHLYQINTFEWPALTINNILVSKLHTNYSEIFNNLNERINPIEIKPCIMTSDESFPVSEHFHKAQRKLAESFSKCKSGIEKDATQIGWGYFNALDRLTIPLDLFESERNQHWGIRSIINRKLAFEKFVSYVSINQLPIQEYLEDAKIELDSIFETFKAKCSPRWDSLIDLCLEDLPNGAKRYIIFSGPTHKYMFIYAMLAREGASESDLAKANVHLLSVEEAVSLINESINESLHLTNFVFATIPTDFQFEKMLPFFKLRDFEILIYNYQQKGLSRKIIEWSDKLQIDIEKNMNALSVLSGNIPPLYENINDPIIKLNDPRTVVGRPVNSEHESEIIAIWDQKSEKEELGYLFNEDENDVIDNITKTFDENYEPTNEQEFVEKALYINFEEGWGGEFDSNSFINIIRDSNLGKKVDSCLIKALRLGDKILYIHGQKRQSLYELVLSRVHNHPSIEIHLVLIQQWQSEIKLSAINWFKNGKSIEDLYIQMRKSGSLLESSQALKYWIEGNTLRPRDAKDLKRIADILSMQFTKQHYARIHSAGDRIAGLHISLSQRLNSWLGQVAYYNYGGNEIIDETTGLTMNDIKDSLIVLTVNKITEINGPFLKSSLNTIERIIK